MSPNLTCFLVHHEFKLFVCVQLVCGGDGLRGLVEDRGQCGGLRGQPLPRTLLKPRHLPLRYRHLLLLQGIHWPQLRHLSVLVMLGAINSVVLDVVTSLALLLTIYALYVINLLWDMKSYLFTRYGT